MSNPNPIQNNKWLALALGSMRDRPIIWLTCGNSRVYTNGGRMAGMHKQMYSRLLSGAFGFNFSGFRGNCLPTGVNTQLGMNSHCPINGGMMANPNAGGNADGSGAVTTYANSPTLQKSNWAGWGQAGNCFFPAYIKSTVTGPTSRFTPSINFRLIDRSSPEIFVGYHTFAAGGVVTTNLAEASGSLYQFGLNARTVTLPATDSNTTYFDRWQCGSLGDARNLNVDYTFQTGSSGPIFSTMMGVRSSSMRGGLFTSGIWCAGGQVVGQVADSYLFHSPADVRRSFFADMIAACGGNPIVVLDCEFGTGYASHGDYPTYYLDENGHPLIQTINWATTTLASAPKDSTNTPYNLTGWQYVLLPIGDGSDVGTNFTLSTGTVTTYNTSTGACGLTPTAGIAPALPGSGWGRIRFSNNNFAVAGQGIPCFYYLLKAALADIRAAGGDALALVTTGTTSLNDGTNSGFDPSLPLTDQLAMQAIAANDEDFCVVDEGAQLMSGSTIRSLNTTTDVGVYGDNSLTGDDTHCNPYVFSEIYNRILNLVGTQRATPMVSGFNVDAFGSPNMSGLTVASAEQLARNQTFGV